MRSVPPRGRACVNTQPLILGWRYAAPNHFNGFQSDKTHQICVNGELLQTIKMVAFIRGAADPQPKKSALIRRGLCFSLLSIIRAYLWLISVLSFRGADLI